MSTMDTEIVLGDELEEVVQGAELGAGGRQCTAFVLDVSEDMFQRRPGGDYYAKEALTKIRDHLNHIALNGRTTEFVTVLFMNTPVGESATNQIITYYECDNVTAELVMGINQMLDEEDDFKTAFTNQYGSEWGQADIAEVFYTCSRQFEKISNRPSPDNRVFFYSRNYDPIAATDIDALNHLNHRMATYEQKFHVAAVLLDLKPGNQPSAYWDMVDKSYKHRTQEINPSSEFFDALLRTSARIPFVLGDGLEIAVAAYNLVLEKKTPTHVTLDAKSNEVTERAPQFFKKPAANPNAPFSADGEAADGPMEEVSKDQDFGYRTDFGHRMILLHEAEKQSLDRVEPAGIRLIGFKPMSCLKPSHRMGHSTYLYPMEDMIVGSRHVYNALYRSCLDKNCFALVRATLRALSTPKVCALIPQLGPKSGRRAEETADEEAKEDDEEPSQVDKYLYEGFHLVELPYFQQKRSMEVQYADPKRQKGDFDAEPRQAVKNLVTKLTRDFTPDAYLNPVQQHHYAMVESLALKTDGEEALARAQARCQCRPFFEDPELREDTLEDVNEILQVVEGNDTARAKLDRAKRQGQVFPNGQRVDVKRARK
ncbi:ATP-dependent DNA helicase 2 subunit 1 [Aphelenchoides fujianensis]|nr:ATP-dependent DNA helicase 2 subunit 1 [Aphelenchoides fujianensis]